jgi:membrane-associated phospholipid phosphatase
MQGGRGFAGLVPQDSDPSSGNDSELQVDDRLHLGRVLDGFLHHARLALANCLALPVAWIYGEPTVQALKLTKMRKVREGQDTILYMQTFRAPWLDRFMQVSSFCAEEEFYLIVLPLLFWAFDYELGFRLTLVVVGGLFFGNIIKDVFELPRPASPPVWRPHNQASLDSTGLQDFGFPSTHAMNAVTNSLVVAWVRAFWLCWHLACAGTDHSRSITELWTPLWCCWRA